ncbi:MAG: Gamma-glutamyl phosphate reductase [Actinobacteria bacterium ADurb.Bin346]|nr:MAG: Gamma-glutamyl phosphate reductase [Actinobacteria bacterium ADurb.Bin346]
MDEVIEIAKRAKICAPKIAAASTELKNRVLRGIAENLLKYADEILAANRNDVENSRKSGISSSMLDRLKLDRKGIEKIAESIEDVIRLADPVGKVIDGYNLANGLILKNIRVPFGVIGIIYEARPNVTVDAAVLCVKAGSCAILRGSSHALATNIRLCRAMQEALRDNGLDAEIIQVIPSGSREGAETLMRLRDYVDLLIPRGGKNLIDSVVANSRVPVIETGIGNCHIYIDKHLEGISIGSISSIIINSKTQRPSVCNAAEKLIVHSGVAEKVLPAVLKELEAKNVKIKGCSRTLDIYPGASPVSEKDWYEEYLDLIIAVKVVDSVEEAVFHINKYGSHHTESIITSDYNNSLYFTNSCDSSTVFVNASTRFTDGGQFGMGAEIGISTQKLHWRGPMGLEQITTNKFIVLGNGQIREQ